MSRSDSHGHRGILISLIIPVFNLEGYLSECLDSITRQPFDNIEIIAVDGASLDESRRILDSWRRKEPRLTVFHADRIGPGRARNLGVAAASGEYIWFVDGDDTIVPGCLTTIADRIERTHPDVLFIGFESVYPDGRSERSYEYELMSLETSECFTFAEQPWVVDLTMTCWNKIIRREFFVSIGAEFASDWPHEDVPVSGLLLLRAMRLAILKEICYRYRVNRSGSIMSSDPAWSHFRIFNSYETVLDYAEEQLRRKDTVVTDDVRHFLFERAIWHYVMILDARFGRISDPRRRHFFERMHAHFVRYVPPGYRHSRGLRGMQLRLIERNSYVAYFILDPLIKLRRSGRRTPMRTFSRWRRTALSGAEVGKAKQIGTDA